LALRRLLAVFPTLWFAVVAPAGAQDAAPLRVHVEVDSGPYYLGEGFALTVGVAARDQRPELELPAVRHADVWTIGTSLLPINATGIGEMVTGENLFLTRLRIMPRRTGPLEVPPIMARLGGRSGRSRPLRLEVVGVPAEGRPAAFLGGVGEFSVQADVSPATIRVGQELIYRITVAGPAAWGMTARPDLARLERLALAPRIEALPDELIKEPPSRTFVTRLRPTRPGEAILPPVVLAAFDPESMRYVSKATKGLAIKALAVPAFDPRSLDYATPDAGREIRAREEWTRAGVLSAITVGLSALALVAQRRWLATMAGGPKAARRFARRMGRRLGRDLDEGPPALAAREITQGLIRYAQLGTGRPPGALTPEETRRIVLDLTRSDELASRAADLSERCDQALFSDRPPGRDTGALLSEARALFAALGQAPGPARGGMLTSP
jgi:hypothetical protein